MSTAAPAGPGKSVAVTVIGLLTVIWGGAHAALGGSLILGGASLVAQLEGEPAWGFGPLLQMIGAFLAALGVAFLLPGLLGILAGVGALLRQQWGRILTFVLAGTAILWGLISLLAYDNGATFVVFGAAQLLYAVLAFVVLIKNGEEFSRPRQGP